MATPLKKYQQMRDFAETPEPSGKQTTRRSSAAGPIFVIQKHRASHLHYDFRLEMEGVLKSWAVPKGPSYDPAVKRLAMMTEDHPYDYASFEGVIPEGNYGGGNVIIWDQGTWEFLEPGDDPVRALKAGKLTFRLRGKKMFGEWALVRIGGRSARDKGNEWLLLKHRDGWENEKIDITAVAPKSVVSGLGVEDVGGGAVWESNRKAPAKAVPTMASRIRRKAAPRKASGGAKRAGAAAARPKKTSAKRSPSKASASAKPSRAAAARSRSSSGGSPRATRPTPRRRPR